MLLVCFILFWILEERNSTCFLWGFLCLWIWSVTSTHEVTTSRLNHWGLKESSELEKVVNVRGFLRFVHSNLAERLNGPGWWRLPLFGGGPGALRWSWGQPCFITEVLLLLLLLLSNNQPGHKNRPEGFKPGPRTGLTLHFLNLNQHLWPSEPSVEPLLLRSNPGAAF